MAKAEEEKYSYETGSRFIGAFIERVERFLDTGHLEKTHQDFIKCYT
jgi:hypothetical protein